MDPQSNSVDSNTSESVGTGAGTGAGTGTAKQSKQTNAWMTDGHSVNWMSTTVTPKRVSAFNLVKRTKFNAPRKISLKRATSKLP